MVEILDNTQTHALYGRRITREAYRCHYHLNPAYREELLSQGLVASGIDEDGNIRIVERIDHPFFLATLFVPQLSEDIPHPLFVALLNAARTQRFASS